MQTYSPRTAVFQCILNESARKHIRNALIRAANRSYPVRILAEQTRQSHYLVCLSATANITPFFLLSCVTYYHLTNRGRDIFPSRFSVQHFPHDGVMQLPFKMRIVFFHRIDINSGMHPFCVELDIFQDKRTVQVSLDRLSINDFVPGM